MLHSEVLGRHKFCKDTIQPSAVTYLHFLTSYSVLKNNIFIMNQIMPEIKICVQSGQERKHGQYSKGLCMTLRNHNPLPNRITIVLTRDDNLFYLYFYHPYRQH